jgi:hypothetical protein
MIHLYIDLFMMSIDLGYIYPHLSIKCLYIDLQTIDRFGMAAAATAVAAATVSVTVGRVCGTADAPTERSLGLFVPFPLLALHHCCPLLHECTYGHMSHPIPARPHNNVECRVDIFLGRGSAQHQSAA